MKLIKITLKIDPNDVVLYWQAGARNVRTRRHWASPEQIIRNTAKGIGNLRLLAYNELNRTMQNKDP